MLTAEIYKEDRRCRKGERLAFKKDYAISDRLTLQHLLQTTYPAREGYRFEIHETYVTMTNLLSGQEFKERYDTPSFCSPSSESYWTM
jgi:beta-galactosidase beta subunit